MFNSSATYKDNLIYDAHIHVIAKVIVEQLWWRFTALDAQQQQKFECEDGDARDSRIKGLNASHVVGKYMSRAL